MSDINESPLPEKPAVHMPQDWTRPTPVKHDSNYRAWMIFFSGLFLLVALWVPVRTAYQRARFKPVAAGVRDADSFIALAYEGISAGKQSSRVEVSRQQFAEQLAALHAHGYSPIGLDDVRDFYVNNRPLPRKAVLITMEEGKRSSYLETRQLLQQYRWKAAMFVRADAVRDKRPDSLRWPVLRDMARSGVWDIGAQSIHGFSRIVSGPDGETGNFFSAPRWDNEANRLETVSEFRARIDKEHALTVQTFRAGTGEDPAAFAFPHGDYGQFDPRAVATRVMNLDAAEQHYGIGFAKGAFLLNTRYTDPRALNRLPVNPDWSTEQFIAVVESAQAIRPWEVTDALNPSRWRTVWGVHERLPDGAFMLRAVRPDDAGEGPASTGALSWMVGSDLWRDVSLRVRFRLHGGQFAIRLRYSPGGEEGVRLLLNTDGHLHLTQKRFGAEEMVLASTQVLGMPSDSLNELLVTVRDRTLVAYLNDELVHGTPLDLSAEAPPGLFGLETWDPVPGYAGVEIMGLDFPRPAQTLLFADAVAMDDAAAVSLSLQREAHRIAAISPPWMDIQRTVPLVLTGRNNPALAAFGRIHHVPVMPRIKIQMVETALKIPPQLLVDEAARSGMDGIYLDCRVAPVEEMSILIPWIKSVYEQLKEQEMNLAITLPEAVKRLTAFASIAALFPGALIAAENKALAEQLETTVPGTVTAQPFSIQAGDLHLGLYHQLAARTLPEDTRSPWARMEAGRRAGFLAYHNGDYDKAIVHWREWLEVDPYSAQALSLIARAYEQQQQYETALEYYARCLQASPGQIAVAIRLAELLDSTGRHDESREQLNLYARIFPENPEILIAQAQWLYRRRRFSEARGILEGLVNASPLNVAARIALLSMQNEPAERYRTMREILALGQAPDVSMSFGHMLLSHELLTYPESSVFFPFIREQAGALASELHRDLYSRFLPLRKPVTDNFAAGLLSDEWIASGVMRQMEEGRYDLRAALNQVETYLRLRRSELMRDGNLTVSLDETYGFFWIYARRSARTMIRFGFDQEGFIHMQAWEDGDLLGFHSRPWLRPPGSLDMRLSLRGDGARGFVNNQEIFDLPLEIPPSIAYGWWGIAPFAFEPGLARARILTMHCEPLPAALALVAPGNANDQIARLRPYAQHLSALAPAWVFQNPDGSLPDVLPSGADVLRMFCAFHRIRLMPVLDLVYDGSIDPEELVAFLKRHRLKGAVIKQRARPNADWLDALQSALERHPASILLLQSEAALWNIPVDGKHVQGDLTVRPDARDRLLPRDGESLLLQEIPVGSVLIPPLQKTWDVLLSVPEFDFAETEDMVTPRLHLLSDGRWMVAPSSSNSRVVADPARD